MLYLLLDLLRIHKVLLDLCLRRVTPSLRRARLGWLLLLLWVTIDGLWFGGDARSWWWLQEIGSRKGRLELGRSIVIRLRGRLSAGGAGGIDRSGRFG